MIQKSFFFLLLILATLAFLYLLAPFFEPILWAVTLAILFYPIHKWILIRFRNRENISALLTLFIIIGTVIAPALFLSFAVIKEGTDLYTAIRGGEIDFSKPLNFIHQSLPSLSAGAERIGVNFEELKENLSKTALQASRWLASHLFQIGQNTLTFTALFFMMLYLLFFFIRDGRKIIELIIRVLPIGDARERFLLAKFGEVSRATIKGTLVVGIVQGTLGGLIFAILGIESAMFWGAVMIILSIVPAVGSALVWLPAAIVFFANGAWIKGIVLLAFGILIIGMVDNFLRPILVGRDTKMPDYLILLSTLGGLGLIGLSGFVLGPIIAAFFLAVWTEFQLEFNPDNAP